MKVVDSPTNLSAQSKSSPKPRSKTVPYRNGFVYERAIPSGRSPIHTVVSSEWRIKVSLSVRGWLIDAGIAGTTQSEDIGARPASASKYIAQPRRLGISGIEMHTQGGVTRSDGDGSVEIMASATSKDLEHLNDYCLQ
ncbi:MAG: hypothetical protein LQ349_001900 [Xanthoria aureola]|nr:MAG: hypothetical protein LQ349_001900 [Xanthoria aureola]